MSGDVSLTGLEARAVTFLDATTTRDVTRYVIEVAMPGGRTWKVARRYSEFKDMHDKLSVMFALNADSGFLQLPPKRLFNNNDPNFIRKRQAELQDYLRSVILNLVPPVPQPLRDFLVVNFYDYRDLDSANVFAAPSRGIPTRPAPPPPVNGAAPSRNAPTPPAVTANEAPLFFTGADDPFEMALNASSLDAFGMPAFGCGVGGDSAFGDVVGTETVRSDDAGKRRGSAKFYDDQLQAIGCEEYASPNFSVPPALPARTRPKRNAPSNHPRPATIPGPSFAELHARFGDSIRRVFESAKRDGVVDFHSCGKEGSAAVKGAGATVFVDDLIQF